MIAPQSNLHFDSLIALEQDICSNVQPLLHSKVAWGLTGRLLQLQRLRRCRTADLPPAPAAAPS